MQSVLNIEPWELENQFPYSFIGPVADSRCLSGRGGKKKKIKRATHLCGADNHDMIYSKEAAPGHIFPTLILDCK